MRKARYPAALKLEAVSRVTEDGYSVSHVAREMGLSEGSLFFWVRRHRQFMRPPLATVRIQADQGVGSLVAYFRKARKA